MKKILLSILGAVLSIGIGAQAHADTLTIYDLSNATVHITVDRVEPACCVISTFTDVYTLTGTLTVDETTGAISSADIMGNSSLGEFVDFNTAASFSVNNVVGGVVLQASDSADVRLLFPVLTSSGYAGGNLCSLANPCATDSVVDASFLRTLYPSSDALDNQITGSFALDSGTLTAEATPPTGATPEPSSLVLLATGIAGLIGAGRRRLQRG